MHVIWQTAHIRQVVVNECHRVKRPDCLGFWAFWANFDFDCDPLLFFRKLLKHCHFLAICEKLAISSNRDGKFPSRQ